MLIKYKLVFDVLSNQKNPKVLNLYDTSLGELNKYVHYSINNKIVPRKISILIDKLSKKSILFSYHYNCSLLDEKRNILLINNLVNQLNNFDFKKFRIVTNKELIEFMLTCLWNKKNKNSPELIEISEDIIKKDLKNFIHRENHSKTWDSVKLLIKKLRD